MTLILPEGSLHGTPGECVAFVRALRGCHCSASANANRSTACNADTRSNAETYVSLPREEAHPRVPGFTDFVNELCAGVDVPALTSSTRTDATAPQDPMCVAPSDATQHITQPVHTTQR